MLEALKQQLVEERPPAPDEYSELLFARKTYRYLRVAIVSMIFTLLLATILQSIDAGSWLGSFSAYYFTPVHAIFIGSMVMIGVCLIAIRGTTDPEDIALNIAGLAAPIVAFVPTAFPNEPGYKNLFEPDALPLSDMQWNNVIALAATAGFALVLAFAIGARGSISRLREMFNGRTRFGFALALAVVAGLVVAQVTGGSQATHNAAAAVLIFGLWFVAMINSVREVRTDAGARSWGYQLKVGFTGSLLLLGATLAVVGLLRLITGDGWLVMVVGIAIAAVTAIGATLLAWPSPLTWFRPPTGQRKRYERLYFAIAAAMVVGAPAFGFWPGDFEHRTLWVELAELVPFGIFWIIQTVEKWDPTPDEVIALT